MKHFFWVALPFLLLTIGCNRRLPVTRLVPAIVETTPVQSIDDAADDPAVFVHPSDPAKSVVIGTDKQNGLIVYNLDGSVLHRYRIGRINNVDLRSNFDLGGEKVTLVVGSNRTDNTLSILQLDPETRALEDAAARPVKSNLEEVYGCCMYQNPNGKTFAFLVGKSGILEQWELFAQKGKVGAKLVRNFDVGGQCEGMVADDELGHLYVGEEDKGIWKFGAEPEAGKEGALIDTPKENKYLKDDIEGLAIYYANNGKGYLLASSQGNNSYAVYQREGNNAYIGSFKIGGDQIDGTEDTDGIDVCNRNLGPQFPKGVFIAQDGSNAEGTTTANQNFKLVSWDQIAKSFDPPLIIDPNYEVK